MPNRTLSSSLSSDLNRNYSAFYVIFLPTHTPSHPIGALDETVSKEKPWVIVSNYTIRFLLRYLWGRNDIRSKFLKGGRTLGHFDSPLAKRNLIIHFIFINHDNNRLTLTLNPQPQTPTYLFLSYCNFIEVPNLNIIPFFNSSPIT